MASEKGHETPANGIRRENAAPRRGPADFLAGGGTMGELIGRMDWSATPLGPIASWPQSLRTAVGLCLASSLPISIAWGPRRTQIYNDGYLPICGAQHPRSLGQDFTECWQSAWPAVGEAFERARAGQSAALANQRIFLDRNGHSEEAFFTFSFSPIRDEAGEVSGVFVPAAEVTQQTLAQRRQRVLRDLAGVAAGADTVASACERVALALGDHALDVPFALLYLLDAEGTRASLAGAAGLESGSPACPEEVDLDAPAAPCWPLARAVRQGDVVEVEEVEGAFGPLGCGPYPESPRSAVVLPVSVSGLATPLAVLVAGVSSRRPLDEDYRTFYLMLREAVAGALTAARGREQERERAEALRENEARTRSMFQMALDCIITIDHEGRVVEFNPAAERTFGYRREDVLGRPMADLIIPPLLRERHRQALAHYLVTGEGPILDQRIEMPALRADGTEFPAELTVTRIPTHDPPHFNAYLRDITDRKDAEQRLRTQYMVSRILAESTTLNEAASKILRAICGQLGWQAGALWYADQKDRVLRCSKVYHLPAVQVPRFKAMTRQITFPPGVGLPGRVWASGRAAWVPDVTQDEDFPRGVVAAAEGLRGAIGLPITLNEEIVGVIEFFSGEIRQPDEELLQMMTAIGAQVGQFLERKRAEEALRASEERFRSMANAGPAIIWTADPTGAVTFHNQRWLDYTGLTPQQNVRDWPALVLHPDDLGGWVEAWGQALRQGAEFEIQVRNRRHDGEYRWFLIRATPIRDSVGRIVEWYGSTTDVHASKQAEETLRRLLHEKEVLLREIHHRVKNNLQVISSLIDLQATSLADQAARTVLEDMSDRVRAMSVVHERLYNAGNLAEVDFAAYARSLLETLWQVHGEVAANVRLSFMLQPLTIPVEPAIPLGLILNELATNALKHAFRGRGDGEVTAGLKQDPAGGEICLWVRDNGTGLPEELNFQRPETLGLRLVQMLTRQLRGSMEVSRDTGTEFRIRFTAVQR